jgi:hypothetical protein
VTGLVTAAAVAAVLLFFTDPLQYVPIALGAVLAQSSILLLDLKALKTFYQLDRRELTSPARYARRGSGRRHSSDSRRRDPCACAIREARFTAEGRDPGTVPGLPGLHSIDRHSNAVTIPGLLLFRFNV